MYRDFILEKAPLVLTQVDRDKDSVTYGSCDRNHWHLKIRDFTSAILQQTALAMALLYQVPFEGNLYFQNERVRDWAVAAVKYWTQIQLSDGSFNEYYPWEHGFPPTAFSLYTSREVYKRLDLQDAAIEESIRKTAKYLSTHIERDAFNQELASITALYNAYLVLNESWIAQAVDTKLERILALQSEEGWFEEYGGADIGYLSVSLDMLAEYYWMSKDERAYEPLRKTVHFLKYFVHPDGTIGGEYASRNTTYFLPNGLEVMAILGMPEAEAMIQKLYGDTSKLGYFLDSVDDRYLSHYLLHSMLRAQEKRMDSPHPEPCQLPYEVEHQKVFQEAGIVSFSKRNYSGIISLRKGGIVKIYRNGQECFLDCGYRVNGKKGTVLATNWQDPSYDCSYNENDFRISGYMNQIKLKVSTPFLHIGLRAAAFLFGNRLIKMLKGKIILVNKHADIQFSRNICLKDEMMQIIDEFSSPEPVTIEHASNMSLRHVASGKFYSTSDLLSCIWPGYKHVKHVEIQLSIQWTDDLVKVDRSVSTEQ